MTFPLLNKRYKFIGFSGEIHNVIFTKYFPETESYDFVWELVVFPTDTITIRARHPWDKARLELVKERFTLLDRLPIEDDPEYREMFI